MASQNTIHSPDCSKEDNLKARDRFLNELRSSLLDERQLLASSPRILVACSGGADSMALLLGLHALSSELHFSLAVGTVDHGLRPDAHLDAAFVASRAADLNLPCSVAHLNLGADHSAFTGQGIEALARQERYRALRQMAATHECSVIATAHTMDDQAETLLLRLCSGCGIRGARGILRRHEDVFRPMLQIRRATLLGFLKAQSEQFRTDPTNNSRAFSRNRLRLDVLPALEAAMGPSAVESLARFCAIAASTEDCLAQLAAQAETDLTSEDDLAFDGLFDAPSGGSGGLQGADALAITSEFSAESLIQLPDALRHRVLERAVQRAGGQLDFATFERLNASLDKLCPQKLQIQGGVTALVRYGRLTLGKDRLRQTPPPNGVSISKDNCATGDNASDNDPLELPNSHTLRACPGSSWVKTWRGMTVTVRFLPPGDVVGHRCVGIPVHLLDDEGLVLRIRQSGDVFRPKGLGGVKKLQDFFVDAKIPRELRHLIPILARRSGSILAIPGIRDGEETTRQAPPMGGVEISLSPLPFVPARKG